MIDSQNIYDIDILRLFPKVIHILGAAGSGTTTLGKRLVRDLDISILIRRLFLVANEPALYN